MAQSIHKKQSQVLFQETEGVRKVILNRPAQLNCLSYEMISQMLKRLRDYENDPSTRLVMLKGNGRAFCSGGDVKAGITCMTLGHWSFGASFFRKQLTLDYVLGTYKKPVVSILHGIVMGGGAGLSMHTSFRVVTENTKFAMPEAAFGAFPDCGASHFLSRLPGYFGEYLGLTGARLDGTEMLACGLGTHFVHSKDIALMEDELEVTVASGMVAISNMSRIIDKFACKTVQLKEDSAFDRLDVINECFSLDTVEEILSSLEKLAAEKKEQWMMDGIKSIKSASPISLKLFLRLIRQGRKDNLEQCLKREFKAFCHSVRRTVNNDAYEGARAKLFDKDGKPQWMPSKLEQVSNEMVEMYFSEVDDDDDWVPLQLPTRSSIGCSAFSKL